MNQHLPKLLCLGIGLTLLVSAMATSTYTYKADECVVIAHGKAPNGKYWIAAHGEGEYGDENFHLYLMDAQTGKKLDQLNEVKGTLDTGADAFYATWSADSREVSIRYRVDRHEAVTVRYRIEQEHAKLASGPGKIDGLPNR